MSRLSSFENQLKGRSAFVTGSTSGIGLTIAKALASAGCNVGLNGFGDDQRIEQLTNQIESDYGVSASYYGADLRVPIEIEQSIQECAECFGRIDILVNNAGIQHVAPLTEFPARKWNEVISVNLSASFHTIKACLPGMIEQRWGRIVNIASVHGLVGSSNKSAYVAAKHGVVGLTKVVALENAQKGVTCNAVCPGYVHTDLIDRQIRSLSRSKNWTFDDAKTSMLSDKHPIGRFLESEEIASLVTFLCSDAAGGITGSSITIDGGWSAQ